MEPLAPATPPAKNETVSQSEIESLLASLGGNGEQPAAGGSSAKSDTGTRSANHHSFPAASTFSANELRKLRMRHEEFVLSLAARLSSNLRLECALQMTKLETVQFSQFTESLGNPTCLTLLNIEPLRGMCLLEVPSKLALCIVDRQLGGPAESPSEARDLTNMETRLVSQVIEMIGTEWCSAFSDLLDLRPNIVRHENSGRFLNFHDREISMLVIGIEIRMGKAAGQIQWALPCPTLKPLIAKLNAGTDSSQAVLSPQSPAAVKWNAALGGVEIRVSAELPGLEFTARHLAGLKLGDVLPITAGLSDRIQICLEGTPKFIGRLGTSGSNLAVQLLKPL